MPVAPLVKQACDACRRRKVRCNATRPCNQCQSAGLMCRSLLQRQKKGRQGKTANILSELRSKEGGDEENIGNSSPSSNPNSPVVHDPARTQQSLKSWDKCQFSRTPGLVTQGLIQSCSQFFVSRMQGTVPILRPGSLQKQVDQSEESLHAYCLVAAFCAFVVTQTGYTRSHAPWRHLEGISQSEYQQKLVDEATEARRHLDPFGGPVLQSIIVAFLLYGCHIGLGNQRHAYYFLREATTLYTASALDADAPSQTDDEDPLLAGKLFWLLLVSERAHAIRRHRPITLRITSDSPRLDSLQHDTSAIGFRCLVDLYRHFDEQFLDQWNGAHATCSMEALVALEERIRNAVPLEIELPDVVMADLRVSQQWLRIMIWQLSTTAGFLSTSPVHECMDFRYPLLIARDLCLATWKLSRQSMEAHGIGLIEKIFEVACTLIDVMACLSATGRRSSAFKLGPQDYLKHFFTLIHDLPGGRARFLPLLFTKLGQTLPSMVDAMTTHLDLQPNPPGAAETDLNLSALDASDYQHLPEQGQDKISVDSISDDRTYRNFNYAEMSRIGDKTPEIDEEFLQYLSYFP